MIVYIHMELANLLKTQISLTEWLQNIGHKDAEKMRKEDNEKRERMAILSTIIDFPFDRPHTFRALDVFEMTAEIQKFMSEHGHELCALRLEPHDPALPKFRMRGKTIREVVETWFKEQNIDHAKYNASFIPHPSDHVWSTILIINKQGIFGEIIADSHEKLTQGFYEAIRPIVFYFDFTNWQMSEKNEAAKDEIKKIISYLHVPNSEIQTKLGGKLDSTFSCNYLCGYFETTTSSEFGLWFIDYNRILGELYDSSVPCIDDLHNAEYVLKGQIGNRGKVTGKAKIILADALQHAIIEKGDILVCDMTTPSYVPFMKIASGIITNRGGILTHAAIVSRELSIPCLVATNDATKILRNGQMIELDAELGIVRLLP